MDIAKVLYGSAREGYQTFEVMQGGNFRGVGVRTIRDARARLAYYNKGNKKRVMLARFLLCIIVRLWRIKRESSPDAACAWGWHCKLRTDNPDDARSDIYRTFCAPMRGLS